MMLVRPFRSGVARSLATALLVGLVANRCGSFWQVDGGKVIEAYMAD